jgi:hypothetical protein
VKRGLFLFIVLIYAANCFAQNSCELRLITPNGGETFIVDSTALIQWHSQNLDDSVILEYSIDNGYSWKTITDGATNGSFLWKTPFVLSNRCLIRVINNNTTTKDWVSGGGSYHNDNGRSIASDVFGNVYTTGIYSDRAYFGNQTLINSGDYNVFLLKHYADGTLAWAKSVTDGKGPNYGLGVATDSVGNVYVCGNFEDTVRFDAQLITATSESDIFLVKYNSDGVLEWVKSIGAGKGLQFASSAATDKDRNVIITGGFYNKVDFGGVTLNGDTITHAYIAKYNSNGQLLLANEFNGGSCNSNDISVDLDGNILITGSFKDSIRYDSILIRSSSSKLQMFVAQFTYDGKLNWMRAGLGGSVIGYSATQDALGNCFVAGDFLDSANFDGISVNSNGWYDGFIIKYLSDGTSSWVRNIGGKDEDGARGIVVDKSNNLYVTGHFSANAVLGDNTAISNGLYDIFILKYNISGGFISRYLAGSQGLDDGLGITSDCIGNVFTTGFFASTVNFNNLQLTSVGDIDPFVWKISNNSSYPDTSDSLFTISFSPGEVYIPDDSAAPGEHKGIPILLGGSVTKNYSKLGAVKFKADVEFNSSLLVPDGVVLPSVIDKGRRTITIESSWDGSSDTLTTIPFLAALGDAEYTTMNIPKFEWLDGFGAPLTLDVETRSGTFKINDICYEGGARLVITGGQFSLSEPIPNPSSSYATIRYDLIEEGQTELIITDVIGRTVRTLFNGDAKPGSYSIRVNTDELATGKYFYTLRTPTLHAMKMLLVEH